MSATRSTSENPSRSPCADALEVLSHGHEQTRALADELVKQAGETARTQGLPFLHCLFNAFDPFW